MKGIHLFLADGFEDMEALGTVDVLRRGGLAVTTVSINRDLFAQSSHGVTAKADKLLSEVNKGGVAGPQDVMIFPGGMPGTKNLAAHDELMQLMQDHWAQGGTVAAICAAPGLVASKLPGLKGRVVTCFDGFESYLIEKGAEYAPLPVAVGGNLITGRSAGYAIDFGLAIVEHLKGPDAAAATRHGLMLV